MTKAQLQRHLDIVQGDKLRISKDLNVALIERKEFRLQRDLARDEVQQWKTASEAHKKERSELHLAVDALRAKLDEVRAECEQIRNDADSLNSEYLRLAVKATAPIPMILTCPACRRRHIDVGKFATHPHHTHACQKCGLSWRPAVVATVGVQFLPGFRDGDKS